MKTLKEKIKEVFPDAEFSRHETDLYVKDCEGLGEWLRENYEFFANVQRFYYNGDMWFDIPFAAWDEKYTN